MNNSILPANAAEQVEVGQHFARAKRNRRQGILGQRYWHSGLVHQPLVDALQQCAASGEHDPALSYVGREFWWCPLECDAHGIDYSSYWIRKRFPDLFVGNCNCARDTFDQVPALDLHLQGLFERVCRAQLDFYGFSSQLANQEIVLAFYVLDYGFVELVSGDPYGSRIDDSRQRYDCYISGAAADVDNHVAIGLGNGQSGAYGGCHRFRHEIYLGGFGPIGSVLNSPALYLCY